MRSTGCATSTTSTGSNPANSAARFRRVGLPAVPVHGRDRRLRGPDDGRAAAARGRRSLRPAQKARAVCIHLVLATAPVRRRDHRADQGERPEPHRSPSSLTDAGILDRAGADRAWARDMLFKLLDVLLHACRACRDEEEIALVVEQAYQRAAARSSRCSRRRRPPRPRTATKRPRLRPGQGTSARQGDRDRRPVDLDDGVGLCSRSAGSASVHPRRPPDRHARWRRGIISGYEGSKPRRVLVDENRLERFVSAT